MKITVIGARGVPNVEGGAEKNAEMLFPLIAEKHDVTLYSIKGYSQATCYKGIKIINTPVFRLLGTEKLPCYIYATLRSFWERPDIIHCQGLGSAVFLLLYKLAARRVVVRYGSVDYNMAKWSWIGRFGFRISEWQLRFADSVIAVAPSLKERLVDRGYRVRIELIPNALDPVDCASEDADQILETHKLESGRFVLGVGRLTAQKNFTTLLRAFRLFRDRTKGGFDRLVIAGGDDGSGYYQRLLEEADDDVLFTGRLPRSEVRALFSRCGVYVNCSVHEGMSNAVLEAISAGCPVLLSDIVENRDLPVDRRHFFTTDDPTALADLLEEVSRQPRDFVVPLAPFANWRQVAAKTLALYDSLFESAQSDATTLSGPRSSVSTHPKQE